MPRDVTPWLTALRAYSGALISALETEVIVDHQALPICTSLPLCKGQTHVQRIGQSSTDLGEKVVREKEYRSAMADGKMIY